NVFKSITYSLINNEENIVDTVVKYIQTLPSDDLFIIKREYAKCIESESIVDGFIAGIAAYLALLFINENATIMNQLIFQVNIPTNVNGGNIVNRNMFRYLSLPLTAFCKLSKGVILQLVQFVQSFINIWDPIFDE